MKWPAIFLSMILNLLSPSKTFRTVVTIKKDCFYINGVPTYNNRYWHGNKVSGLLMNSRMVQGIFDDLDKSSVKDFAYPDTKIWDPDRNTDEFVAAMPSWKKYGLNCFTLNMQGGSPTGYGMSSCINPGFRNDGALLGPYMKRLNKILRKSDELHMVVILGLFYFGQDQFLKDETAVKNGTRNIISWLAERNYCNVIVEIANESVDNGTYDHPILRPKRVAELIKMVRDSVIKGYRYPVGTSFAGLALPPKDVLNCSDFILLHGNGATSPIQIQKSINSVKSALQYRDVPIIINEDDHYNFSAKENDLIVAVKNHVSWGYFDFRSPGDNDFKNGFQSVPVDWRINSKRKMAFFEKEKEITGIDN